MRSFWLSVAALYAVFCVFMFDWRLGLGWLVVSLFVAEG
jgi:hypothetical protein